MATQLTLSLGQRDDATFTSYYAGANQMVFDYLQRFTDLQTESYLYLWGHKGVGLSHLLQSCCQKMDAQGLRAVYLPLAQLTSLAPRVLDELETFALICLDDLDAIKNNPQWEEAIFHLYNRLQGTQSRLLIAAHAVPAELGLQLPDLVSRLLSGVILQVNELNDEAKLAALQLRAHLHGLELTAEVGQFLLHRFPRNLPALFSALAKLDQASLAAQRKLTIPFVKMVLSI